jgi:hypothetical protein
MTQYRRHHVEAEQLTQAKIDAHILDGEPLPFGLKITNCSFHKGDRRVWSWVLVINHERIHVDDWIVQDDHGLHICKPSVFAETYEAVP